MGNTHFHFIVYCFNGTDAAGAPINNVVVDLIAKSKPEAETKAARICPQKDVYQVVQIIEHFGEDRCGNR